MSRKLAFKYYKIGINLPQGSYESQFFFNLSIKNDPTFSYAYFEKSVPFNKRGDYATGFHLLNKAVSLDPIMHLGYRGWLKLVKFKDYNGCLGDLKTLQSLTSRRKIKVWGQSIFFLQGVCFTGLKFYEKAIEMFNQYIESEREIDCNVYLYLGIIFLKQENFSESELFLQKCLKLNARSSESYYYLGEVHSKTKRRKKALSYYKKSIELLKLGLKNKNPYNEHFFEIYLTDLREAISRL